MAKENGAASPKAGHNGGDPQEMASFVTRIETVNEEKASIMGEAVAKCKTLTGDISVIVQEAKDKGIPKKSVRIAVKVRDLERKAKAAEETLEEDQIFYFEQMRHALGDLAETPLGQSALAQAEGEQAPAE